MKLRGQKILKLIDRYAGIPLIFLLGIFKNKKTLPKVINRVGVLLTPAIGDTILISAPLRELKEKLHAAKIILFVPRENYEAAELIGIADEIVPIEIIKFTKVINLISSYNLDVLIDSSQWSRTYSILTFFSKARYTVGFDTENQYRKNIYNFGVRHSNKVHEIINFRNLIASLGITSGSIPVISAGNAVEEDKVSIHMYAGGYLPYLKEWPEENWISIIKYLQTKNFRIYFTGTSGSYNSIENILNKLVSQKGVFNAAGKFSLRETALHLESCRLVLSVNTGIMHLASAVGANLIAINGPTNTLRWGPLNQNSISIKSSYFSAPCLNLGYEYNCNDRTGECMKVIPVQEVINAVNKFIT